MRSRLAHDRAVPIEPQRGEVGELLVVEALAHAAAVEVLHAHQVAGVLAAREQPGDQRRAQVAEMQGAGGGGGEAPVGGHDPIVACSLTRPMADDAATPEQAPRPCPPCRSTGRIVSRLGGSASTVTLPVVRGHGPGHPRPRRPGRPPRRRGGAAGRRGLAPAARPGSEGARRAPSEGCGAHSPHNPSIARGRPGRTPRPKRDHPRAAAAVVGRPYSPAGLAAGTCSLERLTLQASVRGSRNDGGFR